MAGTVCCVCGRQLRNLPTVVGGQAYGPTCIRRALGILPRHRRRPKAQPPLFDEVAGVATLTHLEEPWRTQNLTTAPGKPSTPSTTAAASGAGRPS